MYDEKHSDLPKEDLTMIKDSAKAIINKIDSVLASMDDHDGMEEEISLSNSFEKIKRLYNPLAQQKNHSLLPTNHNDTDLTIPHYLSTMLIQAVGNLVANAIKFTSKDGSIQVIYSVKTEGDTPKLNILVKDSGKGMTDKQITSFNEGKDITRSKGTAGEQSFGIGLAHVRRIVANQNGSIAVEKNKEQGTTFSLLLPLPQNNS